MSATRHIVPVLLTAMIAISGCCTKPLHKEAGVAVTGDKSNNLILYVITVLPDVMKRTKYFYNDKFVFEKYSGANCLIINYTEFNQELLDKLKPWAIIHSGGDATEAFLKEPIFFDETYKKTVMTTDIPQLALCRAFQVIAKYYNADVGILRLVSEGKDPTRDLKQIGKYYFEVGIRKVNVVKKEDPFFKGLGPVIEVREGHRNEIKSISDPLELIASNDCCKIQAWKHKDKPFYGTQFHPEWKGIVPDGIVIIKNFFALAKKHAYNQ